MRLRNVGDPDDQELVRATCKLAMPFSHLAHIGPLIEKIASSKIVLLGEASHGTHEFYYWRQLISLELVKRHGFQLIAVEGDWQQCHKIHQFIKGKMERPVREILESFERWPTWMWANLELADLAINLRALNRNREPNDQVGFYGLDVYSLFESIEEVLKITAGIDSNLKKQLEKYYECFASFRQDERAYARSLLELPSGCTKETTLALRSLLEHRLADANAPTEEALFYAQQNARVIANAENYYRTMVFQSEDPWNVRDNHMLETLETLLNRHGNDTKAIVWAHNTHIGDYKATDMLARGQVNIGGLARERWGNDRVSLVGFGTFEGDVIAAKAWCGKTEKMIVPPAKHGSYEASFHTACRSLNSHAFCLFPVASEHGTWPFSEVRGHRAIGVVYDPENEFYNYVPTSLAGRYDAFLFFDRTRALSPIQKGFRREEFPETWPSGT